MQKHHLLLIIVLFFITASTTTTTTTSANGSRLNVLHVGEELHKETLPLRSASRLYHLQRLKPRTWYEVKISYPASIPASFSLQIQRDNSVSQLNWNRRLLNTEKLVFKTDRLDDLQGGYYVLVRVEPEGVVAIPNVKERDLIVFNIVCDELLLGIPYKAWWVVVLGLFCFGLSFIIPRYLPSYLLQNQSQQGISSKHT